MSIFDLLLMANRNLWRRKMRAILTILGVIIGTASIICMLSLGIGLNESQRANMERWGSLNIIRLNPSQSVDTEGNPLEGVKLLNDETVAELKTKPGITALSPALEINGTVNWQRKTGRMSLIGIDVSQLEQLEFSTDYGEIITEEDDMKIIVGAEVINSFFNEREQQRTAQSRNESRRGTGRNFSQANLGRSLNQALGQQQRPFGGSGRMNEDETTEEDPQQLLGERITLTLTNDRDESRNFRFTVVGILDEKNMDRSWQAFGSLENMEKLSKFMQRSTDRRSSESEEGTYSYILLRTEDVSRAAGLATELREEGFNVQSTAESLEGIEDTTRVIQAVLGGIGGVSLLVAALGITNTMVMSIYERTKEIGINKVIGATNADISAMFLTEAAMIGLIGGVTGIVISYGSSAIINRLAGNFINLGMSGTQSQISVIPPWLAFFAVIFAMAIGFLSGLLPARRAVKLSPIEAIRQN